VKRFLTLFLLLPLLSITSACTFSTDQGATANKIVEQCHEALKQKDWDKLFSLYNASFFAQNPKSAWKTELTSLFDRLGPLQSESADFQQNDSVSRGDYYIYGFTLQFAKGTAKETITVFRGVNDKQLSIAGHVIQPLAQNAAGPVAQ
jgi:hypothetical protein